MFLKFQFWQDKKNEVEIPCCGSINSKFHSYNAIKMSRLSNFIATSHSSFQVHELDSRDRVLSVKLDTCLAYLAAN